MSANELDKASEAEARLRELTKCALDQSVDEIDASTLSRLRQARYAAINQASRKPSLVFSRPALVSVFSMSVLALTLVLLSYRPATDIESIVASDDSIEQLDDFSLLANGEDLDLVNDLDFYEWLEQQDDKGGLG